jgi:hypothetical protein
MECPFEDFLCEAYLSGEVETPTWKEHLTQCGTCAAKLAAESGFDVLLHDAIMDEPLRTEALERRIYADLFPLTRTEVIRRTLHYAVAAAVIVGTLALGTLGYAGARTERSAVCVDAADDHREEVVEKAARKWRTSNDEIASLSQRLLGDPSVPHRIAPKGFTLLAARICMLNEHRYLHLQYTDGGKVMSVFVARDSFPARLFDSLAWHTPDARTAGGLNVASVQKSGLNVLLVSTSPAPELLASAEGAVGGL